MKPGFWGVPSAFNRWFSATQSLLGFTMAFGIGLPALHQLGLIGEGWRLLMILPCLGAIVTVEKMRQRYWRIDAELQVARAILRASDLELDIIEFDSKDPQ